MRTVRALIEDSDFDPLLPGSFLYLLATAARATDPNAEAAALAGLLRDAPFTEEVLSRLAGAVAARALHAVPARPPHGRDDEERWLHRIEELDLARATAARLAGAHPWAAELAVALSSAVAERVRGLEALPEPWLHGALARGDGEPWRSLRATIERRSTWEEADRDRIVAAWTQGRLSDQDAAWLAVQVSSAEGSPWREAYRAHLLRALDGIAVQVGDLDLSPEREPVAWRVALPHVRPDASLVVRRRERETVWEWPDRAPVVAPLASGSQQEVALAGDKVTGPLVARVVPFALSPLEVSATAALVAQRIARGQAPEHARPLALAVAARLQFGPWRQALGDAARAFRTGEDPEPGLVDLVRHAVAARASLSWVAAAPGGADLGEMLRDVDVALRDCHDAVLLLDDDAYRDALGGTLPPEESWWGRRSALERRLPERAVERVIARERDALETFRGATIDRALAAHLALGRAFAGQPHAAPTGEPVVREVTFRGAPVRASVPSATAVARGYRDPAESGHELFKDESVEVRIREVVADGGSLACIRVMLHGSAAADLRSRDAVVVRVPGRAKALDRREGHTRPLLWWGTFAVEGPVEIAVPDCGLRVACTIRCRTETQERDLAPASWRTRFDLEVESGNASAAIRAALDGLRERPENPTGVADAVLHLAKTFAGVRALRGQRALEQTVERLFAAARMQDHLGEVRRLWAEGHEDRIGVALFPVEVGDGVRAWGSVRWICVGEAPPGVSFPPPEQQTFTTAVEHARKVLAEHCPAEAATLRSPLLRWWLEPDVPSNARIRDASVGLAAFVAFASWLGRRAVPEHLALTGQLGDRATDPLVVPEGIDRKLDALRAETPWVRTLHLPRQRDGATPPCVATPTLAAALAQVFVPPLRLGASPPSAAMSARDDARLDTIRRRLRAILAAAGVPLEVATIHRVLSGLTPRVEVGDVVLEDQLAPPEFRRVETASDHEPRFEITTSVEDRVAEQEAHRLLAVVAADPGHPDLPEDSRAYHLCRAGHLEEARTALRELASGGGPEGIVSALAALERVAGARSRAAAAALAGALRGAEDPSAGLVHLAWTLSGAALFAGQRERLLRCTTWQDRLFWLQAAVETMLQFLAACSVAMDRVPTDQWDRGTAERRFRLSDRPSIGDLCGEVGALVRMDPAPGPERTFLERLRQEILDAAEQKRTKKFDEVLRKELASPLNTALHHLGAWQELTEPDGEARARALVQQLLGRTARRLGGVVKLLEVYPLERISSASGAGAFRLRLGAEDGDASALDLRGQVVAVPGWDGPGFYRGIIGGRVRYWHFASARVAYARLPETGAATLPGRVEGLLWTPGLRHALPMPVADDAPPPRPASRFATERSRLPTPLNHACIKLDRLVEGRTIATVAAIDLAVATLLRLAWFAVCPPFGSSKLPWLAPLTKRKLLKLLAEWEPGGASREGPDAVAWYVKTLAVHQKLEGIIDVLERMEHAPGPLEDDVGRVVGTIPVLDEILAASPWNRGASEPGRCELIGKGRQRLWRFVAARPTLVRESEAADAELAEGEVVLQSGAARRSLWPFVLCADDGARPARLAFVAEARFREGGVGCYDARYVTTSLEQRVDETKHTWVPQMDAPRGMAVAPPRAPR